MSLRFQPRTILTLLFILLFAYVVYAAWDMPIQAKLYPWTVAIIALVLLAYQLVREVMPSDTGNSRETGVDIDFTDEEASRAGKRKALELFAWLYGFALLLWLLGFFVSVPLMVLAYMLRHRESLIMTLALPVGCGAVTWVVFGHFLHLPFPPGVILEALGLV